MIFVILGIIALLLFTVWLTLNDPGRHDFDQVQQRERAMKAMRHWKGEDK